MYPLPTGMSKIRSPGFSRIVIEELRQARHKCTESTHVLVVSGLTWNEWQKHMQNPEDLILDIPVGSGYI